MQALNRLKYGNSILLSEHICSSMMFRSIALFVFVLLTLKASPKNYYVDPLSTYSFQVGTEENPWVTLDQVSTASFHFLPGDTIFFRCDRTYRGKLHIMSSGKAGSPIVFTSYGDGLMPEFDNTITHIIKISNEEYIVVNGFKIIDRSVHETDHTKLANTTYAIVLENAPNCTIQNCDISLVGIGISISGNSIGSKVLSNRIYNLRMLRNTVGGNDDFGATAIVLASSNISVTNNRFEDCWGTSYDYLYEGGTVELFGDSVNNNVIAYNTAINNNGFLKIGSISNGISHSNVVAYNKVINCGYLAILQDTGLYRTRIQHTQFYNNTIVETLQQLRKPVALFWMPGEGVPGMIVLKNNIFWLSSGIDVATNKFDKGSIIHTNNIYRLSQGTVGLSLSETEFLSPVSPLFTSTVGSPADWNYELRRGSVAIDFGIPIGFSHDFDNSAIIGLPDAGAFEYTAPIIMATLVGGKCSGDSTLVNVSAKGGVPPYQGTGNFKVFSGLIYFYVTDSQGLKDSIKLLINQAPELSVTVTNTPVSALNPTSALTIVAHGGTPPYVYRLNSAPFQSSAFFTGLKTGNYSLTVQDANGCLTSTSFEIPPYEKMVFVPDEGSLFKIFPNPSSNFFQLNNLAYDSNSAIQLEVYNMKGLLVYSASGRFTDLMTFGHQLPQGSYTVRLQVGTFSQTISVIRL